MADERLSVVDIFKIGVGPSSSHTLGPWRAAEQCMARWTAESGLAGVEAIEAHLYGSLAKTGRGHGTDIAVVAGLLGADPETCDMVDVQARVRHALETHTLTLATSDTASLAVTFHEQESLPEHPNGMRFVSQWTDGRRDEIVCFSIGGGFVAWQGRDGASGSGVSLPFPIDTAEDLLRWCETTGGSIADVVLQNEAAWRPRADTDAFIARVWRVMRECMYRGCHTPGRLPGGLNVRRRAADINARLLGTRDLSAQNLPAGDHVSGATTTAAEIDAWFAAIAAGGTGFGWTLDWVTAFALAVNEENACFGRVVTAPTNGAAGVLPAVLAYDVVFGQTASTPDRMARFLLVASEVGCLFKKGATISAAMGGCQAEIGVSSAMAAAALTEVNGGSPSQALMAAEIAMEHHLGLTCDPVGGLVQIPCIERNTMGAIKAITASQLALASDPAYARVSLDAVIHTMWTTALDMSAKYKETADGGLAVHIPLSLSEC
ncbi:MAG: L-serine ammonia-lyase, iron-sulfur-dependent, subunit alpha [Acidobacteria bacterium]|nr:L-serine ammonia-lyase, iron-sulfur-dependent, subunit alpha [Acidobacteriota bacterium]